MELTGVSTRSLTQVEHWEWFSADVGIIKFRYGPTAETFELNEYSGPSPIHEASWSAIKAHFQR